MRRNAVGEDDSQTTGHDVCVAFDETVRSVPVVTKLAVCVERCEAQLAITEFTGNDVEGDEFELNSTGPEIPDWGVGKFGLIVGLDGVVQREL